MLKTYKNIILSFIISGSLLISASADNATTSQLIDIDVKSACNLFLDNLKLRDGTVNNKATKVKDLQDFLIKEGYLNSSSTGVFGEQTKRALESYQLANGITPSGNLGEMTRESIRKNVCAHIRNIDFKLRPLATNTPSSTKPRMWNASNTVATGTLIACTMEYRECADGRPMKRDINCTWREDMCENSYNEKDDIVKKEQEKRERQVRLNQIDAQIKNELDKKKQKLGSFVPQIFKTKESAGSGLNLVKSAFFDYLVK